MRILRKLQTCGLKNGGGVGGNQSNVVESNRKDKKPESFKIVTAMWMVLDHFLVWRGMVKVHILVVIRFREKKANSKKVSLEKWGWGWRQSDRISVVHTSRHLAAKF